ncbi:Protein kinase dsk1 [Spathaspora sp. JA1]|nr:Protein kinase dsk1 [Spathaspora sp. JA1]
MILVNRNTTNTSTIPMDSTNSNSQSTLITQEDTTSSTTTGNADQEKKPKFNISTFFKKIPNISISASMNSNNSSGSSTSTSSNNKSSLSPVLTSQEPTTRASSTITNTQQQQQQLPQQHAQPHNIFDIATSQPLDGNLNVPAFNQSQYTTLVNDQERYTSFTADCISLQNSEMTSHIEDDDEHHASIVNVLEGNSTTASANASASSSISSTSSKKLFKKKKQSDGSKKTNGPFKKLLRLGSFSSASKNDTINEEETEQHVEHNIDEDAEFDEEDDEIAYLSESESDLNFDPNTEESQYDYKQGGYHPVCKGEIYYSQNLPNREYIILRKLGWGHFSTVWLAKSRCTNKEEADDYYVAIKFVKSSKHYSEAAEDEIRILKTLNDPRNNCEHLPNKYKSYFDQVGVQHPGYSNVMKLLDDFQIEGPNGNHICMVFEILGENVLNLIYKYKRFFKNVDEEIKRKVKQESSATSPELLPEPTIKFNKTKISKINSTKSMLSLNLNSKTPTTSTPPNCSCSTESGSIFSSPTNITSFELQDSISSYTTTRSVEQQLDSMVKQMNSQSLMKLMNKSKHVGGIPMSLVKQIVKQMLLAMDYMHHCGVIHTDLKPENILLDIKDINNIIKAIEVQKLAEHRRSSSDIVIGNGRSRLSRAGSSIFRKHSTAKSRTWSSSSVSQSGSCSLNYRRSKHSINSKHDCPIRTSKPFSSSITSEVLFNDFQFEESNASTTSSTTSNEKFSSFPMISPGTNTGSASSLTYPVNNSTDSTQSTGFGEISIKIADLGNATFVNHHFTNQIQTRQYRSPEIILGYKKWGSSTDIWSIGCIIFELITGDFLFDPHDGKYFNRDEDHLAQIIELIGEFPSEEYLLDCKLTSKYFKLKNNSIILKNIDALKYWSLFDVLVEKYKFDKGDVQVKLLCDFISKCLKFDLNERYDCGSLLNHPWLKEDEDYTDLDLTSLLQNLPNLHDELPGYTNICK